MSVNLIDNVIHLSGAGRLEDAEPLAALLQAGRPNVVDLSAAGTLHTAVVQTLLAFRPAVIGDAGDNFVQTWLHALIRDPGGATVSVDRDRAAGQTSDRYPTARIASLPEQT